MFSVKFFDQLSGTYKPVRHIDFINDTFTVSGDAGGVIVIHDIRQLFIDTGESLTKLSDFCKQ